MKVAFFTSAHPTKPMGLNFGEKMFPLGVGFLLTVLKNEGHEVDFYDRYLTKDFSFPDKQYDFICIYSNTPCFEDTMRIIRHYRNKAKIVVGGPHTSVYPDNLMGIGVNYIVQGEGEQCLLDIVNGVTQQGIIRYPRIKNLDVLPRPDYKLFSTMPYHTKVKWFPEAPIYNYNSSRGCPYNCSFCEVKKVWGRKYTCFSAERVISDIEWLQRDFKVRGIYFREDNFTCWPWRLIKICEGIRFFNLKWLCETRVDTLDKGIIEIMARSGCKVLYIGFESGSQHMLDVFNKGTTIEQGLSIAYWARKYGIQIAGSFITDHPLETQEDKKVTQEFITQAQLATVWKNKYRPNFDNLVKEIIDAERDLP